MVSLVSFVFLLSTHPASSYEIVIHDYMMIPVLGLGVH